MPHKTLRIERVTIEYNDLICRNGFTLFEVLIVLVIIVIMSSLATLSINAPKYIDFTAKARKAAITLDILSNEAAYTNSLISCRVIAANNLGCVRYKDGVFSDIELTKIVSWGWPQEIYITAVYIDGVLLKADDTFRFLPTLDSELISFRVTNGQYSTWLDGGLDGSFSVNN